MNNGQAIPSDVNMKTPFESYETHNVQKLKRHKSFSTKEYNDKYVRVNADGVKIRRYYFPTAQALKLKFDSIHAVYYEKQGFNIGVTKGWGQTLNRAWWACDLTRGLPGGGTGYNVVIRTGDTHDKGFTVDDIDHFLRAIRARIPRGVEISNALPYL